MAVAAVNALRHIDVVAGRSSAAVFALFRFNCDGLCWADGFAEFAGDAALLAGRVTSQSVFATETGRDGALLEWVVDRVSRVLNLAPALAPLPMAHWHLLTAA